MQNLAREKNYCLSFLFLTFSGFGQVSSFGDAFGATSSAVREEFTTEELAQQPLEVLTWPKGTGALPTRPPSPPRSSGRPATPTGSTWSCMSRCASCWPPCFASIWGLQAQLKTLDTTIAHELAGLPQTLDTVSGLGPVWTAGLIGELGDISRFDDQAAIAQYAGLT